MLFDVDIPAINKHLKNIYQQGELIEERTVSKMEIVRMEGNRLELAERMAKRHIPMTMEDWAKQIDTILAAGGNEVLQTTGLVTA